MSWVEARSSLQWRWIQWIQVIIFGAFLPFLMVIPETRDGVILRRKAATMRKEMRKLAGKASTNASVDAEYRARSEVDKPKLIDLVKVSLTRPVSFFYGPQIRKRSKFAKALAAEEERINTEKEVERQARFEKNGQV
ncbi:hypothetical protein QFC24_004727 [Naganishia onofrii]|uniref:Uncharacterized protein n=1 Tax=Naganishia onofrii TaxID=1851511 RepID=A0ACC2XBI6_9TREE|nr:hypothetical protein QFC24_004727 [Naganishia onofrii]